MNIYEAYQHMKAGKTVVSKSLGRTRILFMYKEEKQLQTLVYAFKDSPMYKEWYHPNPIGPEDMEAEDLEVVE